MCAMYFKQVCASLQLKKATYGLMSPHSPRKWKVKLWLCSYCIYCKRLPLTRMSRGRIYHNRCMVDCVSAVFLLDWRPLFFLVMFNTRRGERQTAFPLFFARLATFFFPCYFQQEERGTEPISISQTYDTRKILILDL